METLLTLQPRAMTKIIAIFFVFLMSHLTSLPVAGQPNVFIDVSCIDYDDSNPPEANMSATSASATGLCNVTGWGNGTFEVFFFGSTDGTITGDPGYCSITVNPSDIMVGSHEVQLRLYYSIGSSSGPWTEAGIYFDYSDIRMTTIYVRIGARVTLRRFSEGIRSNTAAIVANGDCTVM